jgi:hypothetical protein
VHVPPDDYPSTKDKLGRRRLLNGQTKVVPKEVPGSKVKDTGWMNTGTSLKRFIDGDGAPPHEWQMYFAEVLLERKPTETWTVTLTRRTADIEKH